MIRGLLSSDSGKRNLSVKVGQQVALDGGDERQEQKGEG
jgi:hypothetical protein